MDYTAKEIRIYLENLEEEMSNKFMKFHQETGANIEAVQIKPIISQEIGLKRKIVKYNVEITATI